MIRRVLILLTALLLVSSMALGETLTMSFVGDCCIGDQYLSRGYKSSFTGKMKEWGMDFPFALCKDYFATDDLTVANCEGTFTERKPTKRSKYNPLYATPEWAEVFKLGYVDVCNTANNHCHDLGDNGFKDTIAALENFGVTAFGDDVLATVTVKGVKIGFVGYSFPHNDAKLKKYKAHIQELRDQGCDFVIASAHWGRETYYTLNAEQKKYGHQIIDAGADMIFGHGAHVCQPIEIYNGKIIFYGLSNFCFGGNAAPKDNDTLIAQVTFEIGEDHSLSPIALDCIPYKMHNDKNFQPWPIENQEDREKVLKKLVFTKKTKGFASGLPADFLTTGHADLPVTDPAPVE